MKKTIFTIILVIPALFSFSQADSWEVITGNGFGLPTQTTVPEMEVFNGYIYASTASTGAGLAELYRSQTGDSGTWQNVTPSLDMDRSIHSFGTTSLDGGYIWFGTASAKGCGIFRSDDGLSWTLISKRGFGNPALIGATPHMVVFQGSGDSIPYLYAGGMSHGGLTPAQVWRTPYYNTDSLNWELIVDFALIDSNVTIASYFCLWQNKIYFGTDGIGQLWESSDGINFSKNTYVGNGFGISMNHVLSSIETFNDTMYVTTTNKYGGQLWRSGDGTNWQMITGNAFGEGSAVSELRSLRTSFGKLWLTAYTEPDSASTGTPVWRSDDGVNFIQSNINGFGDITNNGKNAVTIGFANYQYFGGPNYYNGGQVWRTNMTTNINETRSNNCIISIAPNPVNDISQLVLNNFCPDVEKLEIYSYTGKLIQTSSRFSIEKGFLDSGIYFCKIYFTDNSFIVEKIIME